MATCKTYEFEVTGRGAVPVDMLRYDCCWPADPQAVEGIDASMKPWSFPATIDERRASLRETRTIRLLSHREPSDARWESFGWKCSVLAVRR